jgi:hypothetical protein
VPIVRPFVGGVAGMFTGSVLDISSFRFVDEVHLELHEHRIEEPLLVPRKIAGGLFPDHFEHIDRNPGLTQISFHLARNGVHELAELLKGERLEHRNEVMKQVGTSITDACILRQVIASSEIAFDYTDGPHFGQ